MSDDHDEFDVTCKRCGEDGLFWYTLAAGMKPMLFDTAAHKKHECNYDKHFD